MTTRQNRCEVWLASLSELAQHAPALAAALTLAERAGLLSRGDATTATLSWAVLRLVLARYLDVPAEELDIDRSCPECGRPHGRPRLPAGPGAAAPAPQVSVSHGGDLLAVAVVGRGRVGVDVEPDRSPDVVAAELLELALTVSEGHYLASVPVEERHRLFLHYWTGKEAVLKALGTGLDVSLHAVTLPAPPVGGTTTVTVPGLVPVELTVRELDVGPAHVGALATADPVPDLRVGWWSPTTWLDPS